MIIKKGVYIPVKEGAVYVFSNEKRLKLFFNIFCE